MFGAPQNTYAFGASSANPSPAMGIQIEDLVDSAGEQQARDAQLAAAGYDAAFAQRSGSARQGAAGQPGTIASFPTTEYQKSGADLLEPRLFAMLSNAGTAKSTMDSLGNNGLSSVAVFHSLADDKPSFRALAFRLTGLDPSDMANQCEVAKVVACWASSEISSVVEAKATAERAVLGLAPPILEGELSDFCESFATREHKITKAQTPSEAYFERKLHEASGRFVAEKLTRVTNACQVDHNNDVKMGWNQVAGTFQQQTKAFAVPLPTVPETLRARLEVMAVCFELVKYKLPQKHQLSTQSMRLWDRYIRWLFGADVWGLHSMDDKGRPRSTPAISHIINYDLAIREEVAKFMNHGADIAQAFRIATSDDKLMYTKLSQPFGIDCGKPQCLACSAPGFSEAHSMVSTGSQRAEQIMDTSDDAQPTRGAKKRAAAAKRKALAGHVATHVSKEIPPVRKKEKVKGKGQKQIIGKGGDKAKGAGKGDGGGPVCFDHNKGPDGCKRMTCKYRHVCTKCGGADHIAPNCTA